MGNIVSGSGEDGIGEYDQEYIHHEEGENIPGTMGYSTSTGLPNILPSQAQLHQHQMHLQQQQMMPQMPSPSAPSNLIPGMPSASHFLMGSPSGQQTQHSSGVNWGNDYPLHHAASTGAPTSELNRLVVHEGFDVDEQDDTGSTPLHLAVYYGHEHCAKWLINKGRARYIKDVDGNTPADVARQCGNMALAELIEAQMNASSLSAGMRPRNVAGGNNQQKEEQLYLELDRAQSKISALKASEKRARQELENEVAERVKLFRAFVTNSTAAGNAEQQQHEQQQQQLNAIDLVQDMRMQIVEFKAQRDALAAEMKLVEDGLADFEMLLTGSKTKQNGSGTDILNGDPSYVSPSARLRACLRKV